MDSTMSVGATPEADALRAIADDMLTELYTRAPEATSRADWFRAKTHLTAGLDLLRYHKQSAQQGIDETTRVTRMCATRDAIMAQNLLDIRVIETRPTLVFAQNRHLQRNLSTMRMGPMDIEWHSAGAIVGSMLGERYLFVAGSLGRCPGIGLRDPEPDTYEGALQSRISGWSLTTDVPPARTRTDQTLMQGYFPLDQATLDGADVVLHISDGDAEPTSGGDGHDERGDGQ